MARQSPDDPGTDAARRYFPETQFWVSGDFLSYFDDNGGLEIFGYPISAPYNEQGILVQYFQNARMEWHPANSDPYKVQLGLLGDELGLRRDSVEQPPLSAGRVYFPETGHSVTYMFLRYFRSHGGIDLFGYPITEMFVENQKVVQYFQRMKLIWTPQTGRITVGNLGDLYVNAHRSSIPANVLEPVPQRYNYNEQSVSALRVSLSVSRSVASSDMNQIVTVIVLDDHNNEPLANAQVKLSLSRENGDLLSDRTRILGTDAQGRARFTVPLQGIDPGTWVVVEVEALSGTTSASQSQLFLVWW